MRRFLFQKAENFEILLFFISFVYVLIGALLIQFYIIPNLLGKYHWGLGLLEVSDAVTYHNLASTYTEYLKNVGLSYWELKPFLFDNACYAKECNFEGSQIDTALTGIVSIFYFFLESEPWAFIFFNALMHAISAVLLFKILKKTNLNPKAVFISVLPFIFFPSSAQWWAQIGKDGIFIFGVLLFFYSTFVLLQEKLKLRTVLALFLSLSIILLVRPYYKEIIIMYFLIFFVIFNLPKFNLNASFKLVVFFAIYSFLALGTNYQIFSSEYAQKIQSTKEIQSTRKTNLESNKKDNSYDLKDKIFLKTFGRLNKYRDAFSNYEADSDIDSNISYKSFEDLKNHFPRLLQVSFLAPFPNMLISDGTNSKSKIMRSVSLIEMFIYYFALVVVFLSVFKIIKNKNITAILLSSFASMFLLSYVNPNIGTVYRMRFVFFIFIVSIGVLFWVNNFYVKRTEKNKK